MENMGHVCVCNSSQRRMLELILSWRCSLKYVSFITTDEELDKRLDIVVTHQVTKVPYSITHVILDSKVHRVHMGPIWDCQDPGRPHVDTINFAICDLDEQVV